MAVTITVASPEAEPIIQNLVQLYTYDFTEFWAGTPRGDLLPNGRFDAYPMDDYWAKPGWIAYFIWSNGVLAGFSLVNDLAHSGQPVDHNMAEFFILRKYRGSGTGRTAAETIFSLHPGQWEVAVARKNTPALAFWRRIIAGAANATEMCESDISNEHWNGPVIRFKWPG